MIRYFYYYSSAAVKVVVSGIWLSIFLYTTSFWGYLLGLITLGLTYFTFILKNYTKQDSFSYKLFYDEFENDFGQFRSDNSFEAFRIKRQWYITLAFAFSVVYFYNAIYLPRYIIFDEFIRFTDLWFSEEMNFTKLIIPISVIVVAVAPINNSYYFSYRDKYLTSQNFNGLVSPVMSTIMK